MRILGIDPGTTVMGYGILGVEGRKLHMISMGVVQLHKYDDHALKLKRIFERSLYLVDEYHPDELAIEAPFYGKNVQSMLKLGRAQGIAMAAALYREVPIHEYSPKKIKQAITGNGNASKEQVAEMLQRLLNIQQMPSQLDATDGLAAAVCHYFQRDGGAGVGKKKSGSYSRWKSFINENPDRKKR